jgi:hypothetical protein
MVERKLKTELMEFSINTEMLNGIKRKVEFKHKLDVKKLKEHPELRDTKFHKTMQEMIINLAEKQENILSGDKIVKLAEKSVSRLKLLNDVYRPNSGEDLRKLLMKELNPSQFQKKMEDGTNLFSETKIASMRSLNSRFTKYALLLFSHKEIFKVREDANKVRRIYAKHNDIYPNVYQFSAEGKKIPMANSNTNLVIVTGNELDKLYGKLIQGKAEKIKLPDSVEELDAKGNAVKSEQDETSTNGATAKTIVEDNNFDIFNKFINLADTKHPSKFVENCLEKDFANIAGNTKDPLLEILKPNTAKKVLNFLREVIIEANKQHPASNNKENKEKINQIISITSTITYDADKKEFKRLD